MSDEIDYGIPETDSIREHIEKLKYYFDSLKESVGEEKALEALRQIQNEVRAELNS